MPGAELGAWYLRTAQPSIIFFFSQKRKHGNDMRLSGQ